MPELPTQEPAAPRQDMLNRSEIFTLAASDLSQDFGVERLMDLLRPSSNSKAAR